MTLSFLFWVCAVLLPTETATAEQGEQHQEERGYHDTRGHHTHPLVWLEGASTRDRVAVVVVTGAGLGTVDPILSS